MEHIHFVSMVYCDYLARWH